MSGGSNNIPKGWKVTTLNEIAEVVMGQSPKGNTCNINMVGIPLLNGPTEFTEVYPEPVQYTTDAKRVSEVNDLLFCVRGSTGRMNWGNQQYAIGRGIAAIRHRHGDSYRKFIKGIFDHNLQKLLAEATGSTFPNVSRSQLEKMEIRVPSLNEQQAISNILTTFDDKIELLQAQNQTLEATAQTIFKEWFGKYQIGDELPEGWKVGKLGGIDFISFGDGNYSSKYPKQSAFIEKGVPFISNKDIKNGIIQSNDLRYISSELHSTLKKGHLQKWDIIMSTRANIGDMALVSDTFSGANINAQLVFIRASNKELYTPYLFELFSSKRYRQILENYSSGSAQSQLPMHALKEVEIIIPNKNALKVFSDLWIKLINKKEINQEQIQTLQQTRDTLLPKLMSGKVRVEQFKD